MTPRRVIEPARLASTALLRGQSDARLVDLTRAGNEQAFEAIVHRYRRPLLRYCGRILPPGRAEDAVQQAFLSAYRAICEGDNELILRPWLYRVARNSALNLLRQNGWNHEQLHEGMDGVMRPDQAVEGRERIRSLVASVKDLPKRQRDAIVLRELEGRSYEEIAVALGVTDGAVRQLLNRARTTLRAGATALTPYGLAERLAEIAGGAGGVASLAKVGAAVLVVGAVATGGDRVLERQAAHSSAPRHASTVDGRPPTADRLPLAVGRSPFAGSHSREVSTRRIASHRSAGGRRHEDSAFVENVGTRDDRSGSSGGDSHSGSGDSGSGSRDGGGSGGSSGPGGGDDQLVTTSSGDGSGSGTSGSGTSGSDSSGSGSSGSGSSDGGSTTTTSGGGTSGESH
jgi:RNA polymerase sigma factor (sigma-70 family)